MLRRLHVSEFLYYLVALFFIGVSVFIAFNSSSDNAQFVSSELNIASYSPLGAVGGALMPASGCSGTEGDCAGSSTGSASCSVSITPTTVNAGDPVTASVSSGENIFSVERCESDLTGCITLTKTKSAQTVSTVGLTPGNTYAIKAFVLGQTSCTGTEDDRVCDTASATCAAGFDINPLPEPNLVSINLTGVPGPYTEGETRVFTAQVDNTGGADSGAFHDAFFYAWGLGGAWIEWDEIAEANLTPADSPRTDTSAGLALTQTGDLYISHCVDTVGEVAEETGADNCTYLPVITVNAPPPSPTVTFTASLTSVVWNGSSDLTWTVSGSVDSCTSGGDWIGLKSTAGDTENTGALTSNKIYTLYCTGPGGNSPTKSVSVTVGAAPINGACGPAAKNYAYDDTVFSGATCSAGTSVGASFPPQGGSDTWSCNGSNGGSNASCTATRDNVPAVPAVTIKACDIGNTGCVNGPGTKSVVSPGNVEITWTASGADSCSVLAGPGFSLSGTTGETDNTITEPSVGSTNTYTVRCTNAGGNTDKSVDVTTTATPLPDLISLLPTLSTGSVQAGNTITFTTHVRNDGTATAGPYDIDFYIDANGDGVADFPVAGDRETSNTGVGITRTESLVWTVPAGAAAGSNWQVGYFSDTLGGVGVGEVDESGDETNWSGWTGFTVSATPLTPPTVTLSLQDSDGHTVVSTNTNTTPTHDVSVSDGLTLFWSSTDTVVGDCGTNFDPSTSPSDSVSETGPVSGGATYTVICTNTGGPSVASIAVNVITASACTLPGFSPDTYVIRSGETVNITWENTTDEANCLIDDGTTTTPTNISCATQIDSVSPEDTTTYKLICDGIEIDIATVHILPTFEET